MFEFTVKYWDNEDDRAKECHGLIGASSYTDAANKAVEYCSIPGKPGENIISVYVSELENPLDWEEIKDWFVEKAGEWK